MKKSILNININKEDSELNDFLYCWDFYSTRPSKTSLISSFGIDKFYNFLDKNKFKTVSTLKEIYPIEDSAIVNRKIFSKNENDIFITYTEYDIESEESLINEVHLIHKEERIEQLLEELYSISDKLDDVSDTKETNTKTLTIGSTGFEMNKLDLGNYDEDNIDLYYNDDIIKRKNKLQKSIQKNKNGISVIYGERGVGKTTLVKSIISSLKKTSLFISTTLFESTINNSEFRTFLKLNKELVLILDDSELFFSEIYSKSNIFTNNLLQLVDGLDSNMHDVQIIVVLNVQSIDQIDHTLLESNNLNDILEIKELDHSKVRELSKHLGKKVKPKNSMKLVDILKGKKGLESKSDIGFV